MGEQLSILDTMFLVLEQVDASAHMHIGAALIFDPLPGGGTPDITEFRDYLRGRVGILAALCPAAPSSARGSAHVAHLGAGKGVRSRCPRVSRDVAGAGRRGRVARVAWRFLVAPLGSPAAAVGDDAA